MTYRVMILAFVVGWLGSPTVKAQQIPQATVNKNQVYEIPFLGSGTVVDTRPMWEDVEIFRRILDRAVAGWAAKSGTAANLAGLVLSTDPFGKPNAGETAFWTLQGTRRPSVEGYYLKGYGVVMTATLPWDAQQPVTQSFWSAPKALSEWERVRKELRGEKVESEPSKGPSGRPLADIITKVLADNGRHFAKLGENERVTVAVTLRPVGRSADGDSVWLDLGAPSQDGGKRKVLETDVTTGRFFAPIVVDNSFSLMFNEADQDKGKGARRTEAANYAHLGDQRAKQARPTDAEDAYRKAIAAYEKLVEQEQKSGTPPRELVDDLAALTAVRSKLAQVYYTMGKNAEAARVLEWVAKDYAPLAKNPSSQPAATPAKKPLIGKLIISAPKRLLDQVGTGKLSIEEFKKQVTLDFSSWEAPGKEPAKPTGTKVPPAENKP